MKETASEYSHTPAKDISADNSNVSYGLLGYCHAYW
jgi:hypothetical protein